MLQAVERESHEDVSVVNTSLDASPAPGKLPYVCAINNLFCNILISDTGSFRF